MFFDVYRKEAKLAITCKHPNKTTSLLHFYTEPGVDGEVAEAVAEDVEAKLVIKNPACFLDSVAVLPDGLKAKVASNLRKPIFLVGDEISNALGKFKSESKYKKFFLHYSGK
jgi:hypothetical protein